MLSGLSGLLGTVGSALRGVNDVVNDVAETVSPGATSSETTTGNLISNGGVTSDLIAGLEEGDLTGGVADVYVDLTAPGGVINDLAGGGGLGIEGVLGNVLGTADGLLGTADGLLGGIGDGDLLG
ncbi:hypothetical protein L598_000100002530 [Mesorhizobium sp. J18]|uniref:hypothetical protein n=1 Tax=Mesorhizobium sp. J18 TaxID=935263 RepID=UPI001199032F|nr:hypothetical protein [Mesorhizobium sp. J18]TWH01272.1 hypothetical protein L598_000100002530 [Mesorhizobium sp. J18]